MKALYRKYRPTRLGEVVGQRQVTEVLEKALKSGKISHAYLFIGPRGTGKTSVARIFAHAVNGFDYTLEDDYVDIVEIDGASNRGIDNIRELREKVMIAPSQGKYKIYIIDEVHMLTKEAFNALLKTLEEPPAHVIFIMATTDAYKVPVTITSRAQVYTFHLADTETMLQHLKSVCEKEKIEIDDEALRLVVRRGGGSYRDTLSLLDQISTLSNEKITKEMVVSAMGLPEDEKIEDLLRAYVEGSASEITEKLKDLLSAGIKAETLTTELISHIIASPSPEYMPLLAKLTDVKDPFAEVKLLVALFPNTVVPSAPVPRTNFARKERPATPARMTVASGTETTQTEEVTTEEKPAQTTKTPAETKLAGAERTKPAEAGPAQAAGPFDWGKFLDAVRKENEVIYIQLTRSEHEENAGEVKIYPKTKIIKTILEKAGNMRVMMAASGGVKITVMEPGAKLKNTKVDEKLEKISAIMGGRVEVADESGSPFA